MKDLGELLGSNVDSNQKHVKDHTKPMETDGGKSPAAVSNKKSDKKSEKLKSPKKPTGKLSNKKVLFKKIKQSLNVERIPGSEIKK